MDEAHRLFFLGRTTKLGAGMAESKVDEKADLFSKTISLMIS
jgi:hypothetical protein